MKAKKGYLKIVKNNGKVVFEGPLSDLPLKEDYIISKSIELYNEKEPCIIYRTHIMKKFYLALYDCLNQSEGHSCKCEDIKDMLNAVDLDLGNATAYYASN